MLALRIPPTVDVNTLVVQKSQDDRSRLRFSGHKETSRAKVHHKILNNISAKRDTGQLVLAENEDEKLIPLSPVLKWNNSVSVNPPRNAHEISSP